MSYSGNRIDQVFFVIYTFIMYFLWYQKTEDQHEKKKMILFKNKLVIVGSVS